MEQPLEPVHAQNAEANDVITLKSLRKTAAAMDCELIYVFVPKSSLEDIIHQQARRVAKQQLKRVSHSMLLEQQALTTKQQKEQLEELIKELLQLPLKNLWNE